MKMLRKANTMFVFGITMSAALFLVSCKKDVITPKNSNSSDEITFSEENSRNAKNSANYSDEELFRGIFLMDGNVANAIPVYKKFYNKVKKVREDEQANAEITEFNNQMVQTVNKLFPNYMTELKTAIETENPLIIEQKIDEGSQVFLNALKIVESTIGSEAEDIKAELESGTINISTNEELEEYIKKKVEQNAEARGTCIVFAVVVAVYGAVVHAGAVAVHGAVAIDLYAWVALWGPAVDSPISTGGGSGGDRPFKKEVFLGQLAKLP